MLKLTIVAKILVKKDFVDAVKTELIKLIVPSRNESGCIEYNLHQDNEDPAVFVFYETWESVSFFEKHTGTDHYKTYVRAIDGMIEQKIVNKMTRIEST